MTGNQAQIHAVVLAAGHGRRLRPLTNAVPKPLLPIGESLLVERTLNCLANAGVTAVALNLHHLGEKIRDHLGDSFAGLPLTYSEEPELLGTLGGLTNLRAFLEPVDLAVVINGDSLCDWPLGSIIEAHRGGEAMSTLLFSTSADPRRFGGGVGVEDGRVTGFMQPAAGKPSVFAGVQVFSPRILDGLPVAPLDTVRDLYQPALASGERIDAWLTERPWFDLGTPARYLDAVLATAGTGPTPVAVVDPSAEVADDAELADSVVLAGASVERGARLKRVIVGPGAHVECDSVHESVLLTRHDPPFALRGRDRLDGGLVVTPLAVN